MQPQHRDGLLALAGLVGLAGLAAATSGVEPLFNPVGVVAGIAAAALVEAVFLRHPSQALDLWERRGVPIVGVCAVLAVGILAVALPPGLLAVPVWGLITYLGLLGCILLGARNPVAVLLNGLG